MADVLRPLTRLRRLTLRKLGACEPLPGCLRALTFLAASSDCITLPDFLLASSTLPSLSHLGFKTSSTRAAPALDKAACDWSAFTGCVTWPLGGQSFFSLCCAGRAGQSQRVRRDNGASAHADEAAHLH